VQVSQRIQGLLRGSDVIARLGGDEFAIVMQRLDDDSAASALADLGVQVNLASRNLVQPGLVERVPQAVA
jgi:diguanylate cyclase (GGDEF)-like protein